MGKVTLSGYRCDRCEHEWLPREKGEEPRVCPKCKSPYWNIPRGTNPRGRPRETLAMGFEEVAERVAEILADAGYHRNEELDGWTWESVLSRVRFDNPAQTSPHFPFLAIRQRFETNSNGARILLAQAHPVQIEAGASPERVASLIQNALENPF